MSWVCQECGHVGKATGRCPTHSIPLTDAGDDKLLGESIGPYKLAKLLGSGGMGRVYLGVHTEIGSRVAVKVLSRDATQDPDLVTRFFAEARAVNVVRHEGIVNVIDLNRLPDGRPFIVMEYLQGVPLSSILYAGTLLPLGSYARLIGEVCDALSAAHAAQVVHRDLKPDNIFVSPQGRIKVLDFGIAKLRPELSGRQDSTKSGALLGTPQYMSPEQALARPVDARTDVYSLGLVLYEGATGHRPFEASSLFELLRAQAEEEPADPRSLRPEIPERYAAVLLQSLAKDPDQRFQSAQAMASALAAATTELPEQAWTPLISDHMAASLFPRPHTDPHRSGAPYEVGRAATQYDRSRAPQPSKLPWLIALLALGVAAAAITYTVIRSSTAGKQTAAKEDAPRSKPVAPKITAMPRAVADAGIPMVATADAAAQAVVPDAGPAATMTGKAGGGRRGDVVATPKTGPAKTKVRKVADKDKPGKRAAVPAVARPKAGPPDAGPRPAVAFPKVPKKNPLPTGKSLRIDVARYAKRALSKARVKMPDAKLATISIIGVGTDGLVDVSATSNGLVSYTFNSPSATEQLHSGDPAKASKARCKATLNVMRGGTRLFVQTGRCQRPLVRLPRCSMKQVVARVSAAGKIAPTMNFVYAAHLGTKRPMWFLSGHATMNIPDDC